MLKESDLRALISEYFLQDMEPYLLFNTFKGIHSCISFPFSKPVCIQWILLQSYLQRKLSVEPTGAMKHKIQ